MTTKLNETIEYIQSKIEFSPKYGIVLGSGLGNLSSQIDVQYNFSYSDLPHFPTTTVRGHAGHLVLGTLNGEKVVAVQGRLHYYEGYSMEELVFPIRLLKKMGIETLILSNAAGGLDEKFQVGDLMIIKDHINLLGENPLRGKNIDAFGPRFPSMLRAYNKILINKAQQIADKNNITCHQGVYVGVQGPNFETPAEYRAFHILGGHAVGMSTVAEVIIARHMDLKVFGISVITDLGYPPGAMSDISHREVLQASQKAEPQLSLIIKELIKD